MKYFHFILQHGLSSFGRNHQNLHAAISAQATQIGSFLADESARTDFLTEFDVYSSNLLDFLAFNEKMRAEIGCRTGSHNISREVLVLVCSMLSYPEFDLSDTHTMDKLVIAALRYALPSQPATLKVLATKLAEKRGLLERVTSREGAGVIHNLFSVHFINSTPSISSIWAQKLIGLCSACTGSPICHGITTDVEKWRVLMEIIAALENHQRETEEAPPQHTRNPATVVVRKLNPDDKKSFSSARRRSSVLEPQMPPLPDRMVMMLDGLHLQQPRSLRAIEVLLEQIRSTEIPAIVQAVLPTFPCRPCHDLSLDPKALLEKDRQITRARADSACCFEVPSEEETLFGTKIGLWKVLLSAKALKDIQREMLGGSKEVLEARLRRLASGEWKGGKLSNLSGTPAQRKYLDPPLLEAEVGRQLRILWQVGSGPTEDGGYKQHIKSLWRVVEPKDISKAIDHVVMVWRTKILQPEDNPIFSMFPTLDEASGTYIPIELSSNIPTNSQRRHSVASPSISTDERRGLEDYNKFFVFTKPVMDSFLTNSANAEFPFDISPEEIEVIKHSESGTLIMGRSGTGKTTCLVQKLVRNFTARKLIVGQAPSRQILLTRSKLLVEKLKVYTKRLVESQLSKAISTQAHTDDFTLDEENLMFSKTFGSLEDDDFPLVCTFDQLLRLLENTVELSNRQRFREEKTKSEVSKVAGHYVRRSQIVDFALFKSEYWGQFPTSLSRRYEPGLVFAEILGVIKGSISNDGELGYLSRNDYLALGSKKAPTFSSEERQDVYGIYLRYESLKARNGDRDGIDRVSSLLKFMQTAHPDFQRTIGTFFEEIYVDEVQDQRCMDITLLLKLIKNPVGVHFAGDSAQCISRDSTFRFSDVKAMFYNHFKPLAEATNNDSLVHPKLFQLNKNFRSHQGIISLASFVMELLYKGFPQTVDKMEEEKGQYDGSKPTMFVGLGAEVLAQRLVGLADVFERVSDFGAEQVILVRDDIMKEKVQHTLGEDAALVLSILDSKGMEFDDVFLLDFFSSSPTPSGMRSLKDILVPGSNRAEIERNALLCSELKHLYVAITRPRIQLWILESSAEAAEPIVKLLAGDVAEPLVDVVRRNDPDVEEKVKQMKPAVSSDPKKFSERGYQFLQRGLYKEASFCFRRAKDKRGQTISTAHLKMEEGRNRRGEGSTAKFLELFREAVKLFRDASQLGNAAFCLEDMNCLEEAGDVWVEIGRHDKAASLYKQCRSWRKAFRCYDMLGLYAEAADALRQGEEFNKLIRYLQANREHLEPSQVAAYSKLCTILLAQGRIKEEHQEFVIDSLGTDQEKEEFLRKFGLGKQLVKVLVKTRNYGVAFSENILDGRVADALELGLKHLHEDSSIESRVMLPLRFIEFERLLETLRRTPDEDKQSRPYDKLSTLPRNISDALLQWASLRQKLRTSTLWDVFSGLSDGLHKDILAILMVVNWRELNLLDGCEGLALTELRGVVQALRRTVSLWGSSRGESQELSIAVVMGAFPIPDKQEMWLLQYSPIHEGTSGPSPRKAEELAADIQHELLMRMLDLFLDLEQVARTIWQPCSGDLCTKHIVYGYCEYGARCLKRHTPPSSAECKTRIEGLEMMSSLVCSFHVVYRDRAQKFRVAGDEGILSRFSKSYLPNKRFWLEFLLQDVIFRSAIQHDYDATRTAMSNIASGGSEYAAIFHGLEELLFFRLRRDQEWHLRNDLSSVFEQLQLSESLGPRVASRFQTYAGPVLHKAYGFNRLSLEQLNQNSAFEAFDHLQSTIWHAQRNEASGAQLNLNLGLRKLECLVMNDFTCFHSIIGIFERLGAFLMLWTCQSACIFPASWIKMHLPALLSHPDQITRKQKERDIYGLCLITLLTHFVKLMERINAPFHQQSHDPFYFSYGTRKKSGVARKTKAFGYGIQERNRNLLVIAIIHLTTMNAPPRGMANVYDGAQALFTNNNLFAAKFHRCTEYAMMEQLQACFAQYGGKDSLVLVTIKDKSPLAAFSHLKTRGVPTCTLTSLVESMRSAPSGDRSRDPNEKAEEEKIRRAATKLQAFWRARRPFLRNYRASLELPRGKESAFVFENIIKPSLKAIRENQLQELKLARKRELLKCSDNDDEDDEDEDDEDEDEDDGEEESLRVPRFVPGILCKTVVLDIVGVDFYVSLGELRNEAAAAHALSQDVLTNEKMQLSAVEELIESNDMVELNRIVKNVSGEMLGVKEVGDLYADPQRRWQGLKRALAKEKDAVENMRARLMEIVETLERMSDV